MKMNERRGSIELTPPCVSGVWLSELSDRAVLPAKTEEHRNGAGGQKGERGRFRNRRNVSKLQQVDLGGRTIVATTRGIRRNRLRTGAVCHKCAEYKLSVATASKSVS